MKAALLAYVLASSTCSPLEPSVANCTPYDERCVENRAEVCTSQAHWRLIVDCSAVTPREAGWTCGPGARGLTCLRGSR